MGYHEAMVYRECSTWSSRDVKVVFQKLGGPDPRGRKIPSIDLGATMYSSETSRVDEIDQ